MPADKVTLSTDCGMKPLARMVAKMKLNALAEGAAIVRKEVGGSVASDGRVSYPYLNQRNNDG